MLKKKSITGNADCNAHYPIAGQDGPSQRTTVVLRLVFPRAKRVIPGVRLGPTGEAAFHPTAARSERAEEAASVCPMRRLPRAPRLAGGRRPGAGIAGGQEMNPFALFLDVVTTPGTGRVDLARAGPSLPI